jgi:putative transposase
MKRHGRADIFVTDTLRSYGAAMKVIGNAERQEIGRWLHNRVENSHQPFRRRERAMLGFRRMRSSPPTAPQSTPISTRSAIFTTDQISS